MDEYGCGSIRIKLFWYVTKITLRWNILQSEFLIYLIYMVYGPNRGMFFDLYRRPNLLRGFISSITQRKTFQLMKILSLTIEKSKLQGSGQLREAQMC